MYKKCVVHVGPFKTGSTAFQAFLNNVKRSLFRGSVYIPEIKNPGGHYEWLENKRWVDDQEINNSTGLIISSEIISSWGEDRIKSFDDLLISKGYLPRYIAVFRNEIDVFISMNKDHLRNGLDVFLNRDDFESLKLEPSYNAKRFVELLPQVLKNRTTLIDYSRNLLIDLANHCNMVLESNALNKIMQDEISTAHSENSSISDGREWMLLLLRNTEYYKRLPQVDRQKLIQELLDANWRSDFMEFKITSSLYHD